MSSNKTWVHSRLEIVGLRYNHGPPSSHTANDGRGYIVFNNAQILPCYVVGDRQRLKENRLAQARKFFAYGFGPVPGTSVVIEHNADIEDDEEDYGEYQTNRLDDVQTVDIWTYGLAEETDKDECTSQRKAHYGKSRSIKDEALSD
ncbi:hypothetical protein F5890DRAFT_1554435 [Lentinula detonsa]|uniref:Uncharacterized protein n=1 Tax=Lentinula detonsa TaxID=2804962 RepID=A0AA38PZE8_9AGAR|nr:hypothetical protein F5890DRAFT_1554435 [Lentinula detonsa]